MTDGGARRDRIPRVTRPSRRCCAVDGLIVGGSEVWVVVASSREDVADLLCAEADLPGEPPLRLCRAVLEGGVLLLGATDPEKDPLISDLMRRDDEEHS